MSDILDAQQQYWNKNFTERPEMFGKTPSDPAQKTLELLKSEGKSALLELGGGQGRDTFFFARNGLHVTALDYSQVAVNTVTAKAEASGMDSFIKAIQNDIREPCRSEMSPSMPPSRTCCSAWRSPTPKGSGCRRKRGEC